MNDEELNNTSASKETEGRKIKYSLPLSFDADLSNATEEQLKDLLGLSPTFSENPENMEMALAYIKALQNRTVKPVKGDDKKYKDNEGK